jgi:hypothetical protein
MSKDELLNLLREPEVKDELRKLYDPVEIVIKNEQGVSGRPDQPDET